MNYCQKITHILIVVILLFSLDIKAAEIKYSEAVYQDGVFFIKTSGIVDASPQTIFAILTDYQNLTRVSPKIIESKIIRTCLKPRCDKPEMVDLLAPQRSLLNMREQRSGENTPLMAVTDKDFKQALRQDGDVTVVRTVTKGCVWFMCKKIIDTQATTLEVTDDKMTITAITLPDESNLKIGKMIWEIKAAKDSDGQKNDNQTEINYSAEIKPDFFVPPVIGAFFVKNTMSNEATLFIQSIENLAQSSTKN